MTIVPTVKVTLNASVTPAVKLNVDSATIRLGVQNATGVIPAAANIVYTRQFSLAAGNSFAFNAKTMQIATIDATAPLTIDGLPIVLTDIYGIFLSIVSSDDAACSVRLHPSGSGTTLAANIDLQANGVGALAAVAGASFPVHATNNQMTIVENGGGAATTIVCNLVVIGKQ